MLPLPLTACTGVAEINEEPGCHLFFSTLAILFIRRAFPLPSLEYFTKFNVVVLMLIGKHDRHPAPFFRPLPIPLEKLPGTSECFISKFMQTRAPAKARQTSTRGKKKSRRGDNSFFFPPASVVKSLVYKHRAWAISRTMVEERTSSARS